MRLKYTYDETSADCRRYGHDWPSGLNAAAFLARGLYCYWDHEKCSRCQCVRALAL